MDRTDFTIFSKWALALQKYYPFLVCLYVLSHSSLHQQFGTIYTLYSSSPSILSPVASVIFIDTSNVVICSFKLRKLKFLRGEDSNSISKLTETFPPPTPPFCLIIYDHINYLPARFCVNGNRKI